jgi:plastocyanin
MVLCMAASGGFAIPAVSATTHTIAMDGTRFVPETLTVQRGDRVLWVNKDPFPHTATAEGTFDSKSVAAGHSWSYVASKTGEFAYVCTLHPGMKGTLVVR